jgi:phage terminase large subunit-like protein
MNLLSWYEKKRPRAYETNWHHRWMCHVLETAYRERHNAILELPPRHSKSELTNCYAPSFWIQDQGQVGAMFGLVANSDDLGRKFSSACRNLVELPLEHDRGADWKVKGLESLNSSYRAVGIRGQLSGHGFDCVMFDDVLKSASEAMSERVRENVWQDVASAAINRLSPDGIVIGLQARLHEDDVIGKLLKLDHMKFMHLHLPAMNDSGTEAFFRDGYTGEEVVFPSYEALWPTRYSRAKLNEIRQTVSEQWFMAQYQAQPSMGLMSYFDVSKFPRYRGLGEAGAPFKCWIAVDAAQTQTAAGSYTAFCCLAACGSHLKLIAAERGRWRQDAMREKLLAFYGTMKALTGLWPDAVLVERAAGGYGLIDTLSGQLPIVPVVPRGSKQERAGNVAFLPNRGQVAVPAEAPWLKDWLDELASFPLGKSDQVDSFVHALAYVALGSELKLPNQTVIQTYDALDEYGSEVTMTPELDEWDQKMDDIRNGRPLAGYLPGRGGF